jgi:transcriptional regulator with XRE-family HTH domain
MMRSRASGLSHGAIDKHVGAKLRSAREAISETPATVASAMGVSIATYEKIERGEERPAGEALHRASLLLKVPITYFFKDFSVEKASTSAPDDNGRSKPTEGKQ